MEEVARSNFWPFFTTWTNLKHHRHGFHPDCTFWHLDAILMKIVSNASNFLSKKPGNSSPWRPMVDVCNSRGHYTTTDSSVIPSRPVKRPKAILPPQKSFQVEATQFNFKTRMNKFGRFIVAVLWLASFCLLVGALASAA